MSNAADGDAKPTASKTKPEETGTKDGAIRLKIAPVHERAQEIADRVRADLPTHQGLTKAADSVARAAQQAQTLSCKLRRWLGLHRLPLVFLMAALAVFTSWSYFRFLHVSTLRIALPERDAVELHKRVAKRDRIRFQEIPTVGSRASIDLLTRGRADLAFVQGGLPIPPELPRLVSPESETVLFLLREGVPNVAAVKKMMTSAEDQGSHTVAKKFVAFWGIADRVTFVHDWRTLTAEDDYEIPADLDAVFVIKDLANENTFAGVERLHTAGFRLASANAGARAAALKYLIPTEIPTGHLRTEPPLPPAPVPTYSVATFLVAREGLTPRLLAVAGHLLDREASAFQDQKFEGTFKEASELIQGLEAFFGILIYIGLAFLALMGLDIISYRKRFNELNTIISLISMHQSNKDVLGLTDQALKRENLLYLGLCSDLLGLISVITGYYSQENPSLLYNRLLDIIHSRVNSLKLNIQLKILHASIPPLEEGGSTDAGESSAATQSAARS